MAMGTHYGALMAGPYGGFVTEGLCHSVIGGSVTGDSSTDDSFRTASIPRPSKAILQNT